MRASAPHADEARVDRRPGSMDEEDILDLLELQRLARELLDHPDRDARW